jgi:uncharacterized CHY-type Zn-finger protein
MSKLYCEVCNKFVDYKVKQKEENYNILQKGLITINANIAFCNKCQNELFHEELEKENQNRAFKKYNKDNPDKLELNEVERGKG